MNFGSAILWNNSHPGQIILPSPAQLAAIKPGTEVKILYKGSYFWVEVTRTVASKVNAKVQNMGLRGIKGLQTGNTVEFYTRHIFEVGSENPF